MRDELRLTLRGATHRGDGAEVVTVLRDVDVQNYLQLTGGGVLTALAQEIAGSAEVAERCTAALRERGWEGDEELAADLDAALGLAAPPQLVDLPVDLEALSELLEDAQGEGGAINLRSGEVWPILGFDDGAETGEEAPDLDDPDEWLLVHSRGSRSGYRDMELFIATVVDPVMVDRLSIAISGRGAFGRFRGVLQRDEDLFGRWYGFSDERRLGRARAWLAEAGYRPQPRR